MSQQLSDDWQPKTTACAKACIGVSQIMKAYAFKTGASRDGLPRTLQVGARFFGVLARDYVSAKSVKAIQHRLRRSIQDHRFAASLGICKEQEAPLKVYVFPF